MGRAITSCLITCFHLVERTQLDVFLGYHFLGCAVRSINFGLLIVLLGALLFISSLFALHIGAADMSVLQAWRDLWVDERSLAEIVVWEIRLPRVLLALLVGATLGMAGAAMQGLLRNPLAEPGILGV